MTPGFSFRIEKTEGHARVGQMQTPHGEVQTPTFMPVGTQGSVKGLTPAEVAATGAQIVLGNTYHLWLRPGAELVDQMGGLHAFTKWPHAMLTDSGGYQAFSLAKGVQGQSLAKITDDGVHFRSHLDGTKLFMSPEESMRIQTLLGADIVMQLDDCPSKPDDRDRVIEAVQRSTVWANRCLDYHRQHGCPRGQALFAIIQGGVFEDLRVAHAQDLASVSDGFDGLALGGFSVGEPIESMHQTLAKVVHQVDPTRPRYLMGVGTPVDLLVGIESGVDMFDCVLPTRNARNGQALTRTGKINIKQARFRTDSKPLDVDCKCPCCREGYSRAYLCHLFHAGEMLVLRLLSQHNLWLYGELMRDARAAIHESRFAQFKIDWLAQWASGESQ